MASRGRAGGGDASLDSLRWQAGGARFAGFATVTVASSNVLTSGRGISYSSTSSSKGLCAGASRASYSEVCETSGDGSPDGGVGASTHGVSSGIPPPPLPSGCQAGCALTASSTSARAGSESSRFHAMVVAAMMMVVRWVRDWSVR